MTRKVLMFAAFGVAMVCTGANAQAVRLVSEDTASYYDADESPTSTPAAPKKPSIGSGLDSLSSPSDVPPGARPPRPPVVPQPAPPMDSMDPIVPPVGPGDYAPPYQGPGCDAYGSPSCDGGYASCDGSYASCGDDYSPDSCCCGPCWTFRAEVLIWDYEGNSRGQLLATGTADLTAGAYDFDWASGPRFTFIRHGVLGTCWDLELVYFSIDNWDAAAGLADVDTIQTIPVTNVIGTAPLTSTYGVDLYNGELNLKRSHNGHFNWLFGVRYLELNESLNFDIAAGTATVSSDTSNRLFGGQVGVEGPIWDHGGAMFVTGVSKMGVFNNSSQAAIRTTGAPPALALTASDDDAVAWLAELGLTAGYRLTGNVNLLAGYNLLWIDGIADAPSQLTAHDIVAGTGTVENRNTAFMHGINFGVEWVH